MGSGNSGGESGLGMEGYRSVVSLTKLLDGASSLIKLPLKNIGSRQ